MQKALESASEATEEGGTIVLIAECREGFGDDTFEKWMRQATNPLDVLSRFKAGFELGGHKAFAIARVVKETEVVLISGLPQEDFKTLFFSYQQDLAHTLQYLKEKHGSHFKAIIMPEADSILPVLK